MTKTGFCNPETILNFPEAKLALTVLAPLPLYQASVLAARGETQRPCNRVIAALDKCYILCIPASEAADMDKVDGL